LGRTSVLEATSVLFSVFVRCCLVAMAGLEPAT
jgi:hypothetical protein